MMHIERFDSFLNEANGDTPLAEAQAEILRTLPYLEKLIQKETGVAVKLSGTIRKGRRGDYIIITSQDLTREMGKVGPVVFENFYVEIEGGSSIQQDGSLWFRPMVTWSLPSGGTNGAQFIWEALWYSVDESGWVPGRKVA